MCNEFIVISPEGGKEDWQAKPGSGCENSGNEPESLSSVACFQAGSPEIESGVNQLLPGTLEGPSQLS